MFRNYKLTTIFLLVFTLLCFAEQSVKRGRNEGTANIPASNVSGNGNLFVSSYLQSNYWRSGFLFDPGVMMGIGIADIMQLQAIATFTNFQKLGSTEINVQITTPGNNALRFFGIAVCGHLYLSTVMDTLTGDAVAEKPEFRSFIRPSLIADLDFIAINKRCKLKTYFSAGLIDNPNFLTVYDQISLKFGFEWKLLKNSYYLDAGAGFYKEKKSNVFRGDDRYKQQTFWLEPGLRYRLLNRMSLNMSLKATVLTKVKPQRPLPAHLAGLNIKLDIPIIFKETNTEAIRSLVFVEEQKISTKDRITRSIEQGKNIKTDFEIELGEFEDLSSAEQEKESLKKKEEIQQKMDELESLLKELE
ncbi:MAG: hypothetical protein GX640_07595 [Fibrobacter sp.]|nr:hypothetical protein [Fibrobacter sp.]